MRLAFSKLGAYGRAGNQLFQLAGTLGLANKLNAQVSFPKWGYEKYFFNELPREFDGFPTNQVKEKEFNYHEWDIKEDSDLLGYFQSEKYFEHIRTEIKYQFTFDSDLVNKVVSELPEGLLNKPTILMQFRRTDYVTTPYYYNCPVTYYIQALTQHFPDWQNMNLVFISDDLSYPKIHFGCMPNAYFIDVMDIEQLVVASLCDHFIIANSSFGWWGAWLGEKPHTKVIYPGHLFADKKMKDSNDTKDWAPERWIRFQKDEYKIDLKDCTFTVPVLHDHSDRKKNLDLSVCMLQKDFETNIIIGEQGGNVFKYMEQWCTYMPFPDMKVFHRTKMLNDMAMAAETPFIANWDADVIIPPMQLYMAMLKLRNGADMVFPYDGRFARLERKDWFKPIEKLLDIAAIGDTEPKGRRGKPVPESSVGGAVFFNKESFIEGGMENEYMISFGPEDCERNDRFTTLGFRIERVGIDENGNCGKGLGGCLYHINHWCGPDSSRRNPFFRPNHEELNKIRLMSKDELRLYVDTWAWRHKYTERYYRKISEGAIESAKEVYKSLAEMGIKPGFVIDIGCGVGEWSSNGFIYAGVDHKIPKRSLIIKPEQYYDVDLETDIFTEPSGFKYHLCLCLEVAEHLSEARADILIEMLCNLSDKVLFSAAIPYQGGTGHVNEQLASYWAKKFETNGFYPYKTDIRKLLFHNKNVENWYKSNMILYTKEKFEIDYEIDFIHPDLYLSCMMNLKNQLAA